MVLVALKANLIDPGGKAGNPLALHGFPRRAVVVAVFHGTVHAGDRAVRGARLRTGFGGSQAGKLPFLAGGFHNLELASGFAAVIVIRFRNLRTDNIGARRAGNRFRKRRVIRAAGLVLEGGCPPARIACHNRRLGVLAIRPVVQRDGGSNGRLLNREVLCNGAAVTAVLHACNRGCGGSRVDVIAVRDRVMGVLRQRSVAVFDRHSRGLCAPVIGVTGGTERNSQITDGRHLFLEYGVKRCGACHLQAGQTACRAGGGIPSDEVVAGFGRRYA